MESSMRPIEPTGNGSWQRKTSFWGGFFAASSLATILFIAFLSGQWSRPTTSQQLPPELLKATASHGSSTMAIATGPIDEESEGIFFLDYLSGDLQCWVYYPRTATFGAKFMTNVRSQLPGGKNPEYLMVTGAAVTTGTTNNTRPAACLVYVMDVQEGVFAAYTLPWNRSTRNANQPQSGALVAVQGGKIRAPIPAKNPILDKK